MAKPARKLQPQMSEAERAVRQDLAACYRLVAMMGWDDLISNHISARVPGQPDAFLINPFGLMFDEVTASNLVKINHEGEILEPTRYPVNVAGFIIHSAVHMAREDAGCVMHLHSRDGVAVSALEGGLEPLNQTAMLIRDEIAFHDFEGVAFNPEERERLAKDLGDRNLMFLRNHGTLAVGETVAEAFAQMYALEWACSVQVRTLSMGRPIRLPDPAVVRATETMFEKRSPARIHYRNEQLWPALLRRLGRVSPEYRS